MPFYPRLLGPQLARAARQFPAVLLTGPRRAGKTTLLKRLFPSATYVLAEDPDVVARIRADPRGFLDDLKPPVFLDEVQNVPEVLNYVRTRIDAKPRRTGRWILSGSQEAPLMRGVTESLAGRVAVYSLLPLSTRETPKVGVLRGGFPEVITRPSAAPVWFRSYVQTYLERDVRAVTDIRDLATYRRFIALVASRCGQMLSKTDLAAPLGVSVPTIGQWLGILEVTGQILLVSPFFESFGKRLVKSPKLYFIDSGLACHLLGIESQPALRRSPFHGALFEGFVASEIVKEQIAQGRRPEIYYFRDRQGLEVDFVVPAANRELVLIEAKATHTARPEMAAPLERLANAMTRHRARAVVVYQPSDATRDLRVLHRGVQASDLAGLLAVLRGE